MNKISIAFRFLLCLLFLLPLFAAFEAWAQQSEADTTQQVERPKFSMTPT